LSDRAFQEELKTRHAQCRCSARNDPNDDR
jgi:hypothetical protein